MIALSFTICEMFSFEMCMILTLNFRMGQGHLRMRQLKRYLRLLCVHNIVICNVCPICYRLRNIHSRNMHNLDLDLDLDLDIDLDLYNKQCLPYLSPFTRPLTSQCNRFECLTLKMIVKSVDDLAEN